MRCPHCHADIPDGASPCPRCGKPADDSRGRVLEPELVDAITIPAAGPIGGRKRLRLFRRLYPHFLYHLSRRPRHAARPCLPTIITLTLALFAAVRFGLLAAIGFLVFAAVGRAVTFFLTVRHLLKGRFFNPWVPHLVTWVVCWLLVAWLSGNLN